MTLASGGRRELRDLIEVHRNRALKLAGDGEPYLVPIELATLLAAGGEVAVDETAVSWLSILATMPGVGLDPAGLALVEHLATMFNLEDEVVAATVELVQTQPLKPLANARWRAFELGQRVQVLLLMAHLVAKENPGADSSTS